MALLVGDPVAFFDKQIGPKARVLLINPPVEERRYHWLRWNQPLELLRLSTWLREQEPRLDVKLYDFMLPDEQGAVPKHKVKESWTGASSDAQLWHFGQPFEVFEQEFRRLLFRDAWIPDMIVVSSLTSYWHVSIEKLLIKICTHLDKKLRKRVKLCLYGNYPRFESAHAAEQREADIAFTISVPRPVGCPDFTLYSRSAARLPGFFALDIEAPKVSEHLRSCLRLAESAQRKRGVTRPAAITVAFFNEDLCSPQTRLDEVVQFATKYPKRLRVEGICGIEPRSLTTPNLEKLEAAGVGTLFVEHARRPGGAVDRDLYQPLLDYLRTASHGKKSGGGQRPWLQTGSVTGFVSMGLKDDSLDDLVDAALTINSFFQAVILKPFGYSPSIDNADDLERRRRWIAPRNASPQFFPYVGHGSVLSTEDYDNLVRWQSLLNKRVKGATFDFLGEGSVPRLVRETLIGESWKRRREHA